jgi:hypothetical protein
MLTDPDVGLAGLPEEGLPATGGPLHLILHCELQGGGRVTRPHELSPM